MSKRTLTILLILLLLILAAIWLSRNGFFHASTEKPPANGPETIENEVPAPKQEPDKKQAMPQASKQDLLRTRFEKVIAQADSLFKAEAFKAAKKMYMQSLQVMEDPYPYKQIRKIDEVMAERARKKAAEDEAKKQKVFVQGGSFTQQFLNTGDSLMSKKVTVDDFYISRFEVTVAEYRQYCKATGTAMPKEPRWGWNDKHPIVNVSWNDAARFAKWAGKRLPTSAEWEYAARGGRLSKGYTYSGSNKLDDVGWYWQNAEEQIHPVGAKQPNEIGIYDMTGNAWEWCTDNYEDLFPAPEADSVKTGMEEEQPPQKILRGGSWYSYKEYCTLNYLSSGNKEYKYTHIGFRLVWSVEADRKFASQ